MQEATNLVLEEDGPEAVEQLEWGDDVALHQYAGRDCRRGPPSRAHGHFVEPCLEWELPGLAAEHVGHLDGEERGMRLSEVKVRVAEQSSNSNVADKRWFFSGV